MGSSKLIHTKIGCLLESDKIIKFPYAETPAILASHLPTSRSRTNRRERNMVELNAIHFVFPVVMHRFLLLNRTADKKFYIVVLAIFIIGQCSIAVALFSPDFG